MSGGAGGGTNREKESALEREIGYSFADRGLLREALTHSSFINEKRGAGRCNERLEFLGDSVLSVIVSEHLFKGGDEAPEGELTKERAALVCEESLYRFAERLGLGGCLLLGRGERLSGGGARPSILSDAFEALVAAIYLDGGMDPARRFVMDFVLGCERAAKRDYKTELQEVVQQNPGKKLLYVLVSEAGPDHQKVFSVDVRLDGGVIGSGTGRSKKAAEQNAAMRALDGMEL